MSLAARHMRAYAATTRITLPAGDREGDRGDGVHVDGADLADDVVEHRGGEGSGLGVEHRPRSGVQPHQLGKM